MLGPLCAFLTSLTWAAGSGAYAQLSRRYVPAVVNFNRALVAFPLYLLALFADRAGAMASIAALGEEGLRAHALWLAVSITASYVFGDALFLYAALSLGFSAAQGIAAIYPIWATLAALLFRHEAVTIWHALGLLLAVSGVVMVVLGTREADHVAPPPRLAFLRDKRIGVGIAVATSLAWALNSYAVAHGGEGVHVALGGAFRMGLALLFTPLVGKLQGGRALLFERADYARYLPVIALEAFIGSAFYFYGLSHSPMALGVALTSLAPVMSVPIALAFRWERFSWWKSAGVCIVVVGLVLLLTQGT